jgi:hypothetical protein
MALMQPYVPEQKDYLDRIAKGLQIAQAGYGIKTAYEQGKLRDVQLRQQTLETEEKESAARRRSMNTFNQQEYNALYKVPKETLGAVVGYFYETAKDPKTGTDIRDEQNRPVNQPEPTEFSYIPKEYLEWKIAQSEVGLRDQKLEEATRSNKISKLRLEGHFTQEDIAKYAVQQSDRAVEGWTPITTSDLNGTTVKKWVLWNPQFQKEESDRNYQRQLISDIASHTKWLAEFGGTGEKGKKPGVVLGEQRLKWDMEKEKSNRLNRYNLNLQNDPTIKTIYKNSIPMKNAWNMITGKSGLDLTVATNLASQLVSEFILTGVPTDRDAMKTSGVPTSIFASTADEVKKKIFNLPGNQTQNVKQIVNSLMKAFQQRYDQIYEEKKTDLLNGESLFSLPENKVPVDLFKNKNPFKDMVFEEAPSFKLIPKDQLSPATQQEMDKAEKKKQFSDETMEWLRGAGKTILGE